MPPPTVPAEVSIPGSFVKVTIMADRELSQRETNAILLKLFHTDHWRNLQETVSERIKAGRWEEIVVEGEVDGDPMSPHSARLKPVKPPEL